VSADLYLYVLPNTSESRQAIADWEEDLQHLPDDEYNRLQEAVYGRPGESRPNVWVGQVSWMFASLSDPDEYGLYVPKAVENVQRIAQTTPAITPTLVASVMDAMNVANRSIYGKPHYINGFDPEVHWGSNGQVRRIGQHRIQKVRGSRGVAKRRSVKKFLVEHQGGILYPWTL
jgi:hypothetical protein